MNDDEDLEVVLNGAPYRLAPGTTVSSLVAGLWGATTGVAVAINEDLVPRSCWAGMNLVSHDRIEVLVPTQGG